MTSIDIQKERLRARARWAYELGRLRGALPAALYVLPVVALSVPFGARPAVSVGAGAVLLALVVGLSWRGQVWARAVLPGLLAGLVPLVLPLLLRARGHFCFGGGCWPLCMLACIGGGLIAGVAVGLASAAEQERRGAFLLAAASLAGLSGVLGCALVGAAGLSGMLLAVLVSCVPAAMVAARS